MVYQKTAIQHGSSTLTSRVDPTTLGSSFVMNLVEDRANSAHAFATFSGATNELTLATSAGAKGTLNANVSASQVTTAVGSVTDGTNTLTLEPTTLQFDSDATIVSSGTLTVESLLISGAEISNANLVLSGSTNIHLNSAEVIFGNNVDTGGKIVSSKGLVNGVEAGIMTIDPSPLDDNRGSLVIKGDLTVQGTTTTVNSTEITMADAILELNGGNAAADSGLRVNREGSTAVEFLWDESEDHWTVGSKSIKAATFIGTATAVADLSAFTTDNLLQGTSNLYYTDALADARVNAALNTLTTDEVTQGTTNLYYTDALARAAISVSDVSGDGSLTYNASTGIIQYVGPSATEVRAHFSAGTGVDLTNGAISIGQSVGVTDSVTFANVTANLTGDVTGTVSDLSNHTTADLVEGSNLYYTNARARDAVSVTDSGGDGSLAYDSSTGVITYTGPSETEVRAHFSAGTGVTITDGSVAIGQSVGVTDSVTFANVTANLTGDVTGTVSDLSNHTTTDLVEGTNQYYTDARARGAVSVNDAGGDGSLAYNSGTGVLTYTGPSAAETQAHFSAGHGLTLSGGEYSLGKSVVSYTVSGGQKNYRRDLQLILTTVGTSPFRNPVNGGAATVYVSYGDKLTNPGLVSNLCMGVYHAIVIGGAVNVVSQLEGQDSTGQLKFHLDGTEIVVDNNLGGDATLTLRAVVQFDNTDHL